MNNLISLRHFFLVLSADYLTLWILMLMFIVGFSEITRRSLHITSTEAKRTEKSVQEHLQQVGKQFSSCNFGLSVLVWTPCSAECVFALARTNTVMCAHTRQIKILIHNDARTHLKGEITERFIELKAISLWGWFSCCYVFTGEVFV